MQIKGLHRSIYTAADYSSRYPDAKKMEKHPYYERVRRWEKLKKEGLEYSSSMPSLGNMASPHKDQESWFKSII